MESSNCVNKERRQGDMYSGTGFLDKTTPRLKTIRKQTVQPSTESRPSHCRHWALSTFTAIDASAIRAHRSQVVPKSAAMRASDAGKTCSTVP